MSVTRARDDVRDDALDEMLDGGFDTVTLAPAIETPVAAPDTESTPMRQSASVRPERLRRNQMLADAATVALGVGIATVLPGGLGDVFHGARLVIADVLALGALLAAIGANKLYVARAIARPSEEMRRILVSGALASAVLVMAAFMLGVETNRSAVIELFCVVTLLLTIERRIARRIFDKLRASGRILRRVAVIGTDAHALELADSVMRNPNLGYQVVGFIGTPQHARRHGRLVLGGMEHAATLLREHGCGGAMISLNSVPSTEVNRLTRELTDGGMHVALATGLRDIDITRMRPQGLDGQNMIYVEPTIRTGWRSSAKRVFDVLVAGAGLLATAPFIGVAALLIKLESPGPVFFRQDRVGRDGQLFKMIKLRSMYQDAEQRKLELMAQNESDGPLFKIRNDPRITKVGRVLRKLSIDEFPQFWNVVRGEMSIVGPRPALPSEVQGWDSELHDRLRVLPGITGMWQVSGRSDTSFDDYKRLDLYYVDNWSLLHDLRIVVRTFGVVLLQRGAS